MLGGAIEHLAGERDPVGSHPGHTVRDHGRVIRPLQSGAALVEDVRRADPEALHLWWLGQSGFLVAFSGRHLLLDPYLSDSLTRKYADTDKPHVRMTELVVDPAELAFADAVTASHAHTDHLDADTLRALARVPLVAPAAHRALAAERAGREPLTIDDGETVEVAGFAITAVPAAHEAIERDDDGRMLHLGYVVRCGPFAIYHAGDTIPYEGQAERIGGVDVALLPINGRRPERRVTGNLWGGEAAALAHAIGAGVAVPMHYEQFAFNTESPAAFVAACERLDQPYRVLRAGERLTLRPARAAGTSS
jgi:L-ascorbate metabolism protein UlaG (beta-lactamase superfamily)